MALVAGLTALAPPPPPTERLLTAVRDLRPGQLLTSGDVQMSDVPVALVPAGAARSTEAVVGRVVATAVGQGELLTEARLLAGGLLATYDTPVAVPVRIADAAAVRLLRAGDVVDVLASSTDVSERTTAAARPVAPGVRVVTVPAGEEELQASATEVGEGGLVVLAVTERQAADLAQAEVFHRLSVVLRPNRPPGAAPS